jgi:hypothetical protein
MNPWDTYDRWKLNPPAEVEEDEEAWKADEWLKQEKEKSDEQSAES